MNLILISSLLGGAALVVQLATSKEVLKVSVSVWPPGSNIYLGECVSLQCTVEANSSFVWRYRWFRNRPHTARTPSPRHLVSGDSYSITGVTRADAGSYWCQAERRDSNVSLLSLPATLSVSELPPPALTLTPSSRHIFRGETFAVRCPASQKNSSGWVLKQFSQERRTRTSVFQTDHCSPPGGAVSRDKSHTCVFTAARRHSGLYWCECAEGRSDAVNITVSYGTILLRSPAFAVSEGDAVVLSCLYWTGNHSETVFLKNGAEILTNSLTSAEGKIKMTIENVTEADEGFYKCASRDRKMESPESWLSVRRNSTSAEGKAAANQGSWKWIVASCGIVLLLFICVAAWLIHQHRYQMFCTRTCWRGSTVETAAAAGLPATKQDVTEVQWDLSWMEMSNLLDKQQHPST